MDPEPNHHSTSSKNSPHEDTTTDETFDCSYPECDYKSLWMENVRCHERGHNPTQQWDISCQVCTQTFRSLVGFFHHMSSQHSNKLFCPWCFFLGEDLTDFKAHIFAHSETQPVSCSPSNSGNVRTFEAPMLNSGYPQTTTGTGKFCCRVCFKSFKYGSSLCRHKKDFHHNSNPIANSEQELAGTLEDTQESVTDSEFGEPTTAADVTSMIPSVEEIQSEETADVLIEKVNIEGETLFICTICNYKSNRRRNVKGHLRVHADRRRFACPVKDCKYRGGTSLQHLKTHMLVHTDHRPFGCPVEDCKYRGKLLTHLKKHSKLAHPVNLPAEKKAKIAEENLRSGMDCDNQTEVDVNCRNASMAFACMLCDFIGDSELAALEHARNHKTSSL